MAEKIIAPQWLKEVLKRGYKPKKIHRNFENGMFGYIKRFSSHSYLIPDKLIFVLEDHYDWNKCLNPFLKVYQSIL